MNTQSTEAIAISSTGSRGVVRTRGRRIRQRANKPAEATVRRLKRQQVKPQDDPRPILWMCYTSLLAWCCMLGSMYIF